MASSPDNIKEIIANSWTSSNSTPHTNEDEAFGGFLEFGSKSEDDNRGVSSLLTPATFPTASSARTPNNSSQRPIIRSSSTSDIPESAGNWNDDGGHNNGVTISPVPVPTATINNCKERRAATSSTHSTACSTVFGDANVSERSGNALRTKPQRQSFVQRKQRSAGKPEDCLALEDDVEGHATFFLTLLYESLQDSKLYVAGSIGLLVTWSVLCALFAEWLRQHARDNPGGRSEMWLEDIENCYRAISILGSLFVFTLVFRFNICYDRWWQSRIFWGDIISRCLDLNMMNRRWIVDRDLGDRLSRFITAYAYACKALLRGTSLAEEGEDGKALVQRGVLTQEELDHMNSYPCWQPHFCLEMIRAIIVEAHKVPGGKGIVCDEDHKLHGQFFRCFDGIVKLMTDVIGDAIRTRASGLPASYDAIVIASFFMFFVLAAFVWSTAIGWMTPLIIGCASFVIMLLIVMGTKLVDPFGYDKVDIPMEAFCATIEAQINAIDERSRSGVIEKFARTSKPRASMRRSSATFHIPKLN